MFRMPHERQVGMQDESKVAAHDVAQGKAGQSTCAGCGGLSWGPADGRNLAVVSGLAGKTQIRGALFLAIGGSGLWRGVGIRHRGGQIDS
jgi:hypothetical protein